MRSIAPLTLGLSAFLFLSSPAQAGLFDGLFGPSTPTQAVPAANSKQRLWQLGDFTKIELVEREPGVPEATPLGSLNMEVLRDQLAKIMAVDNGVPRPLFTASELSELSAPLLQALTLAAGQRDVLLLSSARRDGLLLAPSAITARLFVQDGQLALIVQDTRRDFYDQYRATGAKPKFTFPSRQTPSAAVLQSAQAQNKRSDWLSIPLQPGAVNAAASVPSATPSVVTPIPSATAAPTAVTPPTRPSAAAPLANADEIERRLETLKRLRSKNLITEEEYQQLRKESLQWR